MIFEKWAFNPTIYIITISPSLFLSLSLSLNRSRAPAQICSLNIMTIARGASNSDLNEVL